MTQENLINLTCQWLSDNQSKFITTTSSSRIFVAGSRQTVLRAFLNFAIKHYPKDDEVLYKDVLKYNRLNNYTKESSND